MDSIVAPHAMPAFRSQKLRLWTPRQPTSLAICNAQKDEVGKSHMKGKEVLVEIVKSRDKQKRAAELVDHLNKEFFYIASAYLSKAKEEDNTEFVSHVEAALEAAMAAKDNTLRPEIRLFNQLMRSSSKEEREKLIEENKKYIEEKGYFLEVLDKAMKEVEENEKSPSTINLINQFRIIRMEATAAIKRS